MMNIEYRLDDRRLSVAQMVGMGKARVALEQGKNPDFEITDLMTSVMISMAYNREENRYYQFDELILYYSTLSLEQYADELDRFNDAIGVQREEQQLRKLFGLNIYGGVSGEGNKNE